MTTSLQPTLWDAQAPRKHAPRKLTREEFKREAERVTMQLARDCGTLGFIAEDVRLRLERAGIEPPGTDPTRRWSCMAGTLKSLVSRGLLARAGYRRIAKRDDAHGNPSAVYIERKQANGEPR